MQDAALFSFDWWTQGLGTWMAWTRATIALFIYIAATIGAMGVWEYYAPGGGPRHGIFGLDTTRGDRLFMTHLGSCFIMLGWLAFYGTPLWGGVALCALWAFIVFKWA